MDWNRIFRRCHPRYIQQRAVWERSRDAYSGNSSYIEQALIRHVSEVELEFLERRRRAYYFNYPRRIARLITQYVLAAEPVRSGADPVLVEDFSCSNLRANEVMRQFSTLLNIFGSAWMLVEMPRFSGNPDLEQKQIQKIRPYAIALSPLAVPDWGYGSDGKLSWAIVEEHTWENQDPFADPCAKVRRKLWTRDHWYAIESGGGRAMLVDEGRNLLGEVPLVAGEESDGFGIDANHWFEDVVRISDAILNNESEGQMNTVKQMFGLLVISESFARNARSSRSSADSSNEKFSQVLARSAAIWESPEEKGLSRYIAPGGTENAAIREANLNLKRELYDVVGMAVQRETREMQSAESKAYDQQNVRQFLASRADLLERIEGRVWELFHRYDSTVPVPEVIYNRDFAVLDLKESIEGLLGLSQLELGAPFRQELALTALSMLEKFRKISPRRQQEIIAGLSSGGAGLEVDHAS